MQCMCVCMYACRDGSLTGSTSTQSLPEPRKLVFNTSALIHNAIESASAAIDQWAACLLYALSLHTYVLSKLIIVISKFGVSAI